tara:strand:+ start:669 stop:1664 length:996 start_codon:yes stop_codon:yes gene_type:complete
MYNKRIVCDIDDTISFCDNRDWENATPNSPVIQKLISLHDQGWEIYLHTARGSLSAKTPDDARKKYEGIITQWMAQHKVPYDKLIFGKPLGTYYVDDKSITPEDFAELEIEQLTGGLSGADVFRSGNIVHKTADNTLDAAKWYNISKSSILKTPEIYKVVGKTISMEYIIHNTDVDLDIVTNQLQSNSNYYHHDIPDFSTYVNRIRDKGLDEKYANQLEEYSDFYNRNKSFCHGDASIDNILCNDKTIYYIDPIYLPDVYSSWTLDIAKVLTSLKRYDKVRDYNIIREKYRNIATELYALEMSHWIRMYSYHPSKEYVMSQIERVYESIRN